ncbi:MAG: NFACT family protein [Clostridia bacterium]|nr:NFACT family protein [Clostridia bacterium]
MPFDAAMLTASVYEMKNELIGARVEKITVPSREEVIFSFHNVKDGKSFTSKLLISTFPDNSCVHLTRISRENPAVPSSFCLMLRKNLIGARVSEIEQLGFERAVMLTFTATDEMGYPTTRYIVAETMGKYSNLILLNNEKRILLASRLIDISLNSKRPVLTGMRYENPPVQDKRDPLSETREAFISNYTDELLPDKFIIKSYYGFSPLISREIAHKAGASTDSSGYKSALCDAFFEVTARINNKDFTPTLLTDKNGNAVDFSFMPITQYGDEYTSVAFNSVGEMLDRYSEEKNRAASVKAKASDLLRAIQNAEKRLTKKMQILLEDIEESKDAEKYRAEGELITANIYRLKKGDSKVLLTDYSTYPPTEKEVELITNKNPQQNAAIRFKRYTKLKNGKEHATKQLSIAKDELEYIERVRYSLERADSESALSEIRAELESTGYISKKATKKPQKQQKPKPDTYKTSGGYTVYCGKNNIQNEFVTFKLGAKGDIWFHAKDIAGSHVLMVTGGEEPSARDYTDAAMIAAVNSSAKGSAAVEVDYTKCENVKKPNGSKIGFVIYKTNYSTSVLRDEAYVKGLKVN